ncbi:hypothetical protein [Paraburkholderia tuberum]|uniref:Uncharacterized protein n=1 Tax=Paraburkholderia tuberum TaxID=157910 RepID=A0A1H1JS84_9BURK|nr:hypothetical protein [Paraburkholderia tuberum]SDR52863.1 hypothetical protein SAMN05445850_5561 [Paraburkholderia tuberum]
MSDTTLPTCGQMLADAIKAYLALMNGKREVVTVKSLGAETQYGRRDGPALLALIRNLNQRCPCEQSLAILGYPRSRAPMRPVYIDHGWAGGVPVRRGPL